MNYELKNREQLLELELTEAASPCMLPLKNREQSNKIKNKSTSQ